MEEENHRREMINYFKKNLVKGYTLDSLKWALVKQGYSRAMIEIAIKETQKELSETAPRFNEKPIIKHEIIDEGGKPIKIKKSWWKKLIELFK